MTLFEGNSDVKNKETISYQKERCNILYLAHEQHMPTDVLNIGLLHFPTDEILFPCFFTPLLPSNPVCHQLSHLECC